MDDLATRALAPVVRFLNPAGDKWVGCGFLVPPVEESAMTVMTCAHVIAAALGDDGLKHRPDAPGGQVMAVCAAVPVARRVVMAGQVRQWFPSPEPGQPAPELFDIAVVRFEGVTRPAEAGFPACRADVPVDTEVQAYGPRVPSDMKWNAKSNWVDGTSREPAEPNEVEFLTDDDINTNIIIGGFSGGPLTVKHADEVIGMVRSVQTNEFRRAYALPFHLLAKAWPPLSLAVRKTAGPRVPIFDLIDRTGQVGTLSRETRMRLGARDAGQGAAPVIVAVAGPYDEDHGHLHRRARIELARHLGRGRAFGEVRTLDLPMPPGPDRETRLALMAEVLWDRTNAAGPEAAELRDAFEMHRAAWIVILKVVEGFGAEEAGLLSSFLSFWDGFTDGLSCPMFLWLSFQYSPATDAAGDIARWHRQMLQDRRGAIIDLPHLHPVSRDDIDPWQRLIESPEYLGDSDKAQTLRYRIDDLFGAEESLPMLHLHKAIRRAGIDPNKL